VTSVLVVSESNSVWGAERSLLKLAEYAESNGVILNFLIAEGSPLADELEARGMPYEFHRFAYHPALEKTGSLAMAKPAALIHEGIMVVAGAIRLRRKLRGYDSVLVFSVWQAPETLLGGILARVPVDIDLHETFSNPRAMKLVGLISKMSRQVFVPSAVLARRSGLQDSPRVSVIPRPVELSKREPRREDQRPLTVGIFGQIQPHKRVIEVVRAAAKSVPAVRILVVGGNANEGARSSYENEVRHLVDSMPAGNQVLDAVPSVSELMSQCDVVVNASEHEAFGRTIVEAVASGCFPVAVGDWGPREVVSLLGVGAVVETTEDLVELFQELAQRVRLGPLVPSVPEGLGSFEASVVAKLYFSRLLGLRKSRMLPTIQR